MPELLLPASSLGDSPPSFCSFPFPQSKSIKHKMPSIEQKTNKEMQPSKSPKPKCIWLGMNTGPCQLGVRIFQKAGLHSNTDPVIWSLNMKTACKTFFQASDKRVGPSFALVSRLHCAGSCISPVLFTWVIPFEFGATMRVCKVTHMLSVSFIYWNDVGLVFFHLMVQPSNYWHQGY